MKLDFGTVCERDMDMLFLNIFGIDKDIFRLFTSKVDFPESDFDVKEIYLSKSDKDGESDITVVIETGGKKYGILIEDKIDAIAMPEQPEKYIKRGKTGLKNGDYEVFYSFIVCPKKYYANNEDAKRYPYAVMYEEIRDYLKEKVEPVYQICYQEICQAIEKAKKPPKVEINENANQFFRKYKDYQEENYPGLDLTTKREANGYWAHYRTRFGSVYLYHKIEDGKVMLLFNKASRHMDKLEIVADWLRKHSTMNVSAAVANKAGALCVTVPKLDMKIAFEKNDEFDIEMCFKTISELIEAANVFGVAAGISDLK